MDHVQDFQGYSRNRREADNAGKENKIFWKTQGRSTLENMINRRENTNTAKNIILLIGDGMSLSTVTAARVMAGQRLGVDGASHQLSWEKFPHMCLAKPYILDALVPDSAATAFAMFSGVKTKYYTFGYDSEIQRGSVSSMLATPPVSTVLEWAQEEGMATGLVTTTRVTHATPAALFAKSAHRDWECDSAMPQNTPPEVGLHTTLHQSVDL